MPMEATVEEYDPVGGEVHLLRSSDGTPYECSQWCDILRPEGAEPLPCCADDFFAGAPAVTMNRFGAGRVHYIGTHADESYWLKLLGDIAQDAELAASRLCRTAFRHSRAQVRRGIYCSC